MARKYPAADGVMAFELAAADGGDLPAYSAGAHVDVHVRQGVVRQYSLCGPRDERSTYLIGVLEDPKSRGGSRALSRDVAEGDLLEISAPRNLFSLKAEGSCARLFAGGIGITPIIAMAQELSAAGIPFHLYYAGHTRARMAFLDRLNDAFASLVTLHVTDEAGGRLDLEAAVRDRQTGEQLYVCGPAGFTEGLLSEAKRAGWPPDTLHREHFSADALVPAGADSAFTVILARSGMALTIPFDRTVLNVLIEHGIDVGSSCEQGVCGTCVVPVLAGRPDHRDLFMSNAEHAANTQFTPCCSRSLSRELTLDL